MENIQVQQVLFCILVLMLINALLCLEHFILLLVLALVHPVALFFLGLAGSSTHFCRARHRNVILCLKSVNKTCQFEEIHPIPISLPPSETPFPLSSLPGQLQEVILALCSCPHWEHCCARKVTVLISAEVRCASLLQEGLLSWSGKARICPPSRLGFNWPGLGSLVPSQWQRIQSLFRVQCPFF